MSFLRRASRRSRAEWYKRCMTSRSRLPLIGTVVVVAALVLGLVSTTRGRADASPTLPAVAPQELLASTIGAVAAPHAISGDVTSAVDIGIPAIPSSLGGGSAGPVASLLGTQHFKVWRSPDGVRIAHITDFAEQVVVANTTDAWLWDSNGMKAEHVSLAGLHPDRAAWFAPSGMPDPASIAAAALTAVGPYANVSVDTTAVVAGRPVYQLVLAPSGAPRTLVGTITVAIDAETRLPLQLDVTAKGATTPAIRIGFTSVSFDPIDPATFTFTPPPGATITTRSPSGSGMSGDRHAGGTHPQTRVFGSGFDTRVAFRLDHPLPDQDAAFLPFAGPLFSVLPVHAGGADWVLVGPVDLDTLREDAARLT